VDPVSDFQRVEIVIDQAVAMEIQLGAFMSADKPVVLGRIHLRHLTGKDLFVRFDLARQLPLVFRQPPLGGLERTP